MLKFLIVVLAIVLIAVLLYFMPIRIKLKTIRKDENDVIAIGLKTLYGILNLKFEVPFLDIVFVDGKLALKYKAEVESAKTSRLLKQFNKIFTAGDFQNIKKYFRGDKEFLHHVLTYWSRVLTVNDLSIIIKYGLTDAALAAWIYGAIWTVLGTILSLVKCNINATTKDIVVIPYFDRETFHIEFSCIIKFKFGNIINTGIMALKRRRELKRMVMDAGKSFNAS